MIKNRYFSPFIKEFLEKRMVFLGGPRQVGKTTLCLQFLDPPNLKNPAYLNRDDLESKKKIKTGELPVKKVLLFDEIHKYRPWRNLLKGVTTKEKLRISF